MHKALTERGFAALLALVLASCGGSSHGWWHPAVGATWDWQLLTPVDLNSAQVEVYDIDTFENDSGVVSQLHALGRKVVCYVDVGSWENWRSDAKAFPPEVLGAVYVGFTDENWLDIRRLDVLAPIMRARFDMAQSKGCDAIEPDNMDVYDTSSHESSGFPLTYQDQLKYNQWIADEVHARHMAVAMKNDLGQVGDLVGLYDFVISEECFATGECDSFQPFLDAGKPVLDAEYNLDPATFCSQAAAKHISAIRKKVNLDSYRLGCQ